MSAHGAARAAEALGGVAVAGVVALAKHADLLIYDTQFTKPEYLARPHWGHSHPDDAIAIARDLMCERGHGGVDVLDVDADLLAVTYAQGVYDMRADRKGR